MKLKREVIVNGNGRADMVSRIGSAVLMGTIMVLMFGAFLSELHGVTKLVDQSECFDEHQEANLGFLVQPENDMCVIGAETHSVSTSMENNGNAVRYSVICAEFSNVGHYGIINDEQDKHLDFIRAFAK